MKHTTLKPEQLRLNVPHDSLGFETLLQAKDSGNGTVGQLRATSALSLGLGIKHHNFNIYIAGAKETGAFEMAETYVREAARQALLSPGDWCYVFNFKAPDEPIAIELPKGSANVFRQDMEQFVEQLKTDIPKIFEGEAYLTRKEEVIRDFNQERNQIFEELDKKAKEKGFSLQADQSGMMVVPAKQDGTLLTPEEISALAEEEQQRLKEISRELHKEMGAVIRKVHELEQGVEKRLKGLDKELVSQLCDDLMSGLKEKYSEHASILEYLSAVCEDVIKNMDDFRPKASSAPIPFAFPGSEPSFSQYEVNVIVDNTGTDGAPVIIETNPSYPNLFGAAEKKAQFGALFTDFTMIKAGAMHKANGGYLIVKALDLLKWPFSYESLKRSLKNRQLEIEDPAEQYGLFVTKTLKPRSIPLNVKVVLVGEPDLYQLLYNYDEDFRDLFKIKAHMDTQVDATAAVYKQFVHAIKTIVEKDGLKDLHKSAVARLIEHAAFMAGSQEKLSLKLHDLSDILHEADFLAKDDSYVMDWHVQKAIDVKKYRSNLYEERIQEMLVKDRIKVQTSGSVVGQVNGLAVYDLGDYMFGKPSRITASISLGKDGVVNIEREAELSGNIHTKGVMILAGYLKANFARDFPLTISASICFEQSYGMVDGDSASGAELFALLSAISGVPIDQAKAVTGAVSQKGEILPIGGATQKIEGFYDLCKERGLDGSHGVLIPETNVKDLVLKSEVIEAVRAGRFHIFPVNTVEQAMEILTGATAGKRTKKGNFPSTSLFGKVEAGLRELATTARDFSSEKNGNNKELGQQPKKCGS